MTANNEQILDYYENLYDENGRETRRPIEFIRTKEILSRYLNGEKLAVADLCGATGVYSYWLAAQGHEVHLLDLVEGHIAQARQKGAELGVSLASLTVGDARSLPYPDKRFDVVLLMGALYHLQEESDRMLCLREAMRVLKDTGVAMFSYVSRYALLVSGLRRSYLGDPEFDRILSECLKTGRLNNPGKNINYFTTAFFHTPELIRQELSEAGFQKIELYAVGGIANLAAPDIEPERLLLYIKMTEQAPELLGVSSHLLAVATIQ